MIPYEFTQGPNIDMLRHLVTHLCWCSLHICLLHEAKSASISKGPNYLGQNLQISQEVNFTPNMYWNLYKNPHLIQVLEELPAFSG